MFKKALRIIAAYLACSVTGMVAFMVYRLHKNRAEAKLRYRIAHSDKDHLDVFELERAAEVLAANFNTSLFDYVDVSTITHLIHLHWCEPCSIAITSFDCLMPPHIPQELKAELSASFRPS